MLVGALSASLLGNILEVKRITRAGYGSKDLQSNKGKGITRAGYETKLDVGYGFFLELIFKPKIIIRMNPDLMEFILEIIYLMK